MRFYKSEIKGTFLPDAAGSRSLGSALLSFLEVHSATFIGALTGNVTGNVAGDLTGDVYSDDPASAQILDNGATGNLAWFKGDVRAEDANPIIFSGSNLAASWASLASIKATNGSDVLVTNTTVANSTFLGVSTRSKYA